MSRFTDTRSIRRRRSGAAVRARSAGFNLLELMMAVTIGGILLGIGAASFKYVTNANRVSTEVNALLGDLMLARSEAIRQSYNVVVCPLSQTATPSSLSCAATATSNWQYGWLVFSDPDGDGVYTASTTDVLIHVQTSFSGTGDTFQSDQSVTSFVFNSQGFTTGLPATKGHITVTLHTSSTNNQWTRCVQVGTYGALTTERYLQGDCS